MSIERTEESHREYATTDSKSRKKTTRRMVKLPGEKTHIERSDSAVFIARKIQVDKMEKRIKNG